MLVFIGFKMLLDTHDRPTPYWFQIDVPTSISLLVVAGIILISIVASIAAAKREKRNKEKEEDKEKEKEKRKPKDGDKDA